MNIKEIKKDNEIILAITGRIDTNTSVQVQAEILKGYQKTNCLTLDLKEVDYVSSAGLRTLLIAQKTAKSKKGQFVIANVSDGVMQVLIASGVTKVLTIQ